MIEDDGLFEDNIKLIQRCRQALESEDAPHQDEWIEMVESLCNALEKREMDWNAMLKYALPVD